MYKRYNELFGNLNDSKNGDGQLKDTGQCNFWQIYLSIEKGQLMCGGYTVYGILANEMGINISSASVMK